MAKTKIALQEELKKMNEEHELDFVVSDDFKELQGNIKAAKIEIKKKKADNKGAAKVVSKGAVFVWLKSPAYVDKRGEKRVAGGLYHISLAQFPRLAKHSTAVCEIFEDKIPSRKLGEIAKWFGINVEKHKDDELLEMLIKEPTLY